MCALVLFHTFVMSSECVYDPEKIEAVFVVTGQKGRISVAKRFSELLHKPLFISGVGKACRCVMHDRAHITIGRAKNTFQNSLEIKDWIRKHRFKTILLITHNYHMPRLLLHLDDVQEKIIPCNIKAHFQFSIEILELHKYIYTLCKKLLRDVRKDSRTYRNG